MVCHSDAGASSRSPLSASNFTGIPPLDSFPITYQPHGVTSGDLSYNLVINIQSHREVKGGSFGKAGSCIAVGTAYYHSHVR